MSDRLEHPVMTLVDELLERLKDEDPSCILDNEQFSEIEDLLTRIVRKCEIHVDDRKYGIIVIIIKLVMESFENTAEEFFVTSDISMLLRDAIQSLHELTN